MSEYFKWVKNRWEEPMYFMASSFGYSPINRSPKRQSWRFGFSDPLRFGIDKNTKEIDPPYKEWKRDCLVFFFEKISVNQDEFEQMLYYIQKWDHE